LPAMPTSADRRLAHLSGRQNPTKPLKSGRPSPLLAKNGIAFVLVNRDSLARASSPSAQLPLTLIATGRESPLRGQITNRLLRVFATCGCFCRTTVPTRVLAADGDEASTRTRAATLTTDSTISRA
jgi:hypothetical protein